MGEEVREKYYKPGSTVVVNCQVTNYRQDFLPPGWARNGLRIVEARERNKGTPGIYCNIPQNF